MKRLTLALSATTLGALSVTALHGGSHDSTTTGWPLILGHHPASVADAGPGAPRTDAPPVVLAASGDCNGLYDNGNPNNVNGYSNFTANVGPRRALLDDFEVPNGETWTIVGIHHQHVWNTMDPGAGTDQELAIWTDAGGVPEKVLIPTMMTTAYSETATGQMAFNRPVTLSWAEYAPGIVLDAGRYWFESAVVGPEDDFWMTADQQMEECWVHWDELNPPLQPGSSQFGVMSDLNWCLSGTSAPGPANQFGLKHNRRGEAVLEAPDATLVVTNIGMSGDDGFLVELGEAAGGWLGHTGAAPVAGQMTISAMGVRDGTPDLAFGAAIATFGATNEIALDLTGLDATTFTRRLFREGVLVDGLAGIPGGMPGAATTDPIPGGRCRTTRGPDNVTYLVELDAPVDVTGFGTADAVELVPDQPTPGIEGLTDVSVTALDTGDLVLDDGGIVMFGNAHRRTGMARMTTGPGQLRVSNLGASGLDGVRVDAGDAEAIDATVEPIDIGDALDEINLTATGCFENTGDSDLGGTSIFISGNITVLEGDFAPIATVNTVRIELYDDGVLIATADRPGGGNTMFLFPDAAEPFPSITGVGAGTLALPGFVWQFDANLDVRTGLGSSSSIGAGDEIRVLAAVPDAAVESIAAVILTTSRPSVVLTGETVTNPGVGCTPTGACCIAVECSAETEADCLDLGGTYQGNGVVCEAETCLLVCDPENGDNDGDGCVGFSDVLAVLSNWETTGDPGIPGDSNCDGAVGFADILLILSTWGEGCE